MNGKPVQVGSKVRVPEHTSEALGVTIPAFTATVIEIIVDRKGAILRVRQKRVDHDRAVRPTMVKRLRFKAAA